MHLMMDGDWGDCVMGKEPPPLGVLEAKMADLYQEICASFGQSAAVQVRRAQSIG
jgi:hypothetical protein